MLDEQFTIDQGYHGFPSPCHETNNTKRLAIGDSIVQKSRISQNSGSLVRSALHFLMGSPATRQGHEKLVYRLIHLFSSTEIFSKRRKICSCWRKTRAIDDALDLTLCSNWPANAHGTQYRLSPATTHASSHCQRPHKTPSGDRSLTLFASTV